MKFAWTFLWDHNKCRRAVNERIGEDLLGDIVHAPTHPGTGAKVHWGLAGLQTWSRDLEKFAAEHADAAFEHWAHTSYEERCNIPGFEGKYIGENMRMKSIGGYWNNTKEKSQLEMAKWAIQDLCTQGDKYDYDSPTFDADILPANKLKNESLPLHFTQVFPCSAPSPTPSQPFKIAWKEAQQIGCAFGHKSNQKSYEQFIICTYFSG